MTNASWMRHFVMNHPTYNHDSIVHDELTYELLWQITKISVFHEPCPLILSDLHPQSALDQRDTIE